MPETTIAIRLGRVIYWAGCGIAGLIGLAGAAVILSKIWETHSDRYLEAIGVFLSCGVAALIFWLLGRGARYVLANE
jgi:hypothetical protein